MVLVTSSFSLILHGACGTPSTLGQKTELEGLTFIGAPH